MYDVCAHDRQQNMGAFYGSIRLDCHSSETTIS